MAKVIIELWGHGLIPLSYKGFDHFPVCMGRGYDNDFIIYDPHVCARHIILKEDQQGWLLEDGSAHNGVIINGEKADQKVIRVQSGDEFLIGQTRLRIFSPQHKVSPAVHLSAPGQFFLWIKRPTIVLSLILIFIGISILDNYNRNFEKFILSKYLFHIMSWPVMIMVWSGLWALLGNLIRHRAQFMAQMGVSAFISLGSYLLMASSEFVGYLFGSDVLQLLLGIFWGFILVALLLFLNLSWATRLSLKRRLIPSLVISFVIYSLYFSFYLSTAETFRDYPRFCVCLKPPFMKVLPKTTADNFLKKSEEVFLDLKKQLEKEKIKEN